MLLTEIVTGLLLLAAPHAQQSSAAPESISAHTSDSKPQMHALSVDPTVCRQPHVPDDQRFKTLIALTVSSTGLPEDVTVAHSGGNTCLDKLSQDAVRAAVFTPAQREGTAVSSPFQIEFTLSTGSKRPFALVAPVGSVPENITPPIVVKAYPPQFPHSFFHPTRSGDKAVVLIDFIVGIDGIPGNLHILRSDDDKYNESALNAVAKYRFKPSLKDGVPIPAEIHIDVNFGVR